VYSCPVDFNAAREEWPVKRWKAGLVAVALMGLLMGSMLVLGARQGERLETELLDTERRETGQSVAVAHAPEAQAEGQIGSRAMRALARRAPARLRPEADGIAVDPAWPDLPAAQEQAQSLRRMAAAGLPDAGEAHRVLANERVMLAGADAQEEPATYEAAVLVLPVEFAGSETLTYQVHNEDGSECITVTNTFEGPRHGEVPYPGGTVTETLDNQTVYYPSTEPEDYERLIFGRTGYTEPLRAGDPNVNDGRGVDISGLTVQSYFDAQSDGRVVVTGTVAPWVAVPQSEAWYGIDYCIPNVSPRAIPDEQLGSLAELTIAAAEALKASGGVYATREFWADFDRDDDGVVDGLWMIHAGRGQEYGGGSEGETAIWSRASAIRFGGEHPEGYVIHDGGTPDDPGDDVRIDTFTMLPEDSDLGVLVEEFGHSTFGVPDLYTNDASNSVGWWAPMSAGIWGGELGGSRPVNMPLWFRSVADCGGTPCGWADPVRVLSHTTPGEIVVLGRAGEPAGGVVEEGPYAGETIHEGLRIDLPEQVEVIPNRAGEGGGAYSGNATGRPNTLVLPLDLRAQSAPLTVTMDAAWSIPRWWGYAYVEVARGEDGFTSLPDLDGRFTDDNPFGLNEGNGLTDAGEGKMRFDLSAFAGEAVRLRLRYFTYRGGPGTGWWVDNLRVEGEDGEVYDEPLDAWPEDWAAAGWGPVPLTLRHPHHYLVEWRDDKGFDAALRTPYQTVFRDRDEWRVDRVPANVPGALVMYRNLKYPFSGALLNQSDHLPSWGPKYALLVVDPNFQPVQRPSGGSFSSSLESLDAALSLQDQPAYTLTLRHPTTGAISATDRLAGSPGRASFDDALATTAGLRRAEDGTLEPWDPDGSVVTPSRDGRRYSTRVTNPQGDSALASYGLPHAGAHVLGSGRPGDDNVALGVHVEVIDQAPDGSWGVVRVHNGALDYRLTVSEVQEVSTSDPVTFTLSIDNRGSVAQTVTWTLTIPTEEGRDVLEGDAQGVAELAPGTSWQVHVLLRAARDAPPYSRSFDAVAQFDDGSDRWLRRTETLVRAPMPLYVPATLAGATLGEGAVLESVRSAAPVR